MVEPRTIARRGTHAIVADSQGALVGMLTSSSGDAQEFRAGTGDWVWAQLLTDKPRQAVHFYQAVFGYTGMPDTRSEGGDDYLLASQGYARAGISHMPDASQARPTWIGFVRVDDLGETLARAQSLGGRILRAPTAELFDGRLAIISDPLGGFVGLVELKDSDFPGDAQ
jgi:predicted enzyme related to lactoylglutathione lyase